MAQAKVTSIEAIESFRARLILFLTKANCSINEILSEINRTRYWIENDQRLHWEREWRKRTKILDQAEQELMSARFSGLTQSMTIKQAAVLKAKRALTESEEKLRKIKQWNRDFDSMADPLAKKLESLRGFLDYDLPKGVAFLANIQKTLESYTETAPSSSVEEAPADVAEVCDRRELDTASEGDEGTKLATVRDRRLNTPEPISEPTSLSAASQRPPTGDDSSSDL